MSKAEDINTLFRRFGGDASSYQEIVAGELADVAEQKWPILGQVRLQAHREAPAAHKGAVVTGGRQVDAFKAPPPFAVEQTRAPAPPPVLPLPEAPVVTPPASAEPPALAAAPAVTPSPVASAVSLPPVAPTDSQAEAVAGEPVNPDLQNLFNRLVPRKVEVPVQPPVAPLKRLVKW